MTNSAYNQGVSLGRIEVVPEVLMTIAYHTALKVEGVARMAEAPAGMLRRYRRRPRHNGVLLDMRDDQIALDLYVVMAPQVNIMEISRNLQAAVMEAMDRMVGVPVTTVNVHVEDVTYQASDKNQGE